MNPYEFVKKVVITCFIISAFVIVAGVSAIVGRHQAEDWNVTNKHLKMESRGYNYCPYCGEQLKGESKWKF